MTAMNEHDHAVLLVRWMTRRRIVFLHVPNERKVNQHGASRAIAAGLQPGFPDYLILTATIRAPRGVAIELKPDDRSVTRMNKKKRERQLQWREKLNAIGIPAAQCVGWEASIEFLETWGY